MTSTLSDPAHTEVAPHDYTMASLSDLTERERDVLELITNGYSNAEISRMLYLSLNTIKTYVRTSYRKVGAETRSQAIVWGVRHGLLAGIDASVDPA